MNGDAERYPQMSHFRSVKFKSHFEFIQLINSRGGANVGGGHIKTITIDIVGRLRVLTYTFVTYICRSLSCRELTVLPPKLARYVRLFSCATICQVVMQYIERCQTRGSTFLMATPSCCPSQTAHHVNYLY